MPERRGSEHLYLSDVSPQDKPWDVHRANASRVQALYQKTKFQQYAARIQHCSQILDFICAADNLGEFKCRLSSAHFCRVRHCPVCQWRKVLKWRARFFTAVPKVTAAYPKTRWLFLTLTVRNCPVSELRATLGHMNKSWERLSKRKQFPALGFVRSTEVTRDKDGDAHPHFHCLLLVSNNYFSGQNYITQAKWSELWQQALRVDYTPIVDVRSVKPRYGTVDTLSHALLETLKYSIKTQDLLCDATWLEVVTEQLHNTRSVSVGGVLKDYIDDREPDDLVHIDEDNPEESEAWLHLFFGWHERHKRYVKTD